MPGGGDKTVGMGDKQELQKLEYYKVYGTTSGPHRLVVQLQLTIVGSSPGHLYTSGLSPRWEHTTQWQVVDRGCANGIFRPRRYRHGRPCVGR